MNVVLVGFDYSTTPIEVLEACSCNKDDITYYLSKLVTSIFFNEMVIVSTCNRTEWVFCAADEAKALDILLQTIHLKTNVALSILKQHVRISRSREAVQHLFQVSCGLKSMVLGENEILAQIKLHYSMCMEFGATGSVLNKVFQSAIATGKDVRDVTQISKGAHSISSIAVEAIKKECSTFIDTPMLLIGAGVMIQRAIAKLVSMGHTQLSISNRTMSKAEALADIYPQLSVIPYVALPQHLAQFSVVYVGISANEYLFRYDDICYLKGERVMVDVGVPRNIDPECATISGLNLISIDQLKPIAEATIGKRTDTIPQVQECIDTAMQELVRWEQYRSAVKPIVHAESDITESLDSVVASQIGSV
jgi:glutamyl-tRNA reductase